MTDNPNQIEQGFLDSWDSMEKVFSAERHLVWLNEMSKVIKQLRERGYDRKFRAGQSLTAFIISRSIRHGLRNDQAKVYFDPRPDGTMRVSYQKRPNPDIVIEVDRMELTPEIEPLLQKLLEQPID
ncbi:MAG: hypothetical protein HY862_04805 [Chloroflexi bacterium]|nr:hypothetical protein [Chloroflexota bacterium]